jgi:ribonuclease P/MRP protein subunit RPP40
MKMHGVDDVLCSQIEAEKDRWRAVLKRLLEVIKLLSTQNLALRGHVETLDVANPGNFIAVLKLLSKYDPVMANHFAYIRQNPRCVSYLSHDILLEFLEFVSSYIDRGFPVDVIYLDFQKAFDKVPHRRLMLKINSLGISGSILKWIENWLQDREQKVVMLGSSSRWIKVKSGVPQGSVLGPLLFLIYINDIDEVVASKILKFADDPKLYGVVANQQDIERLKNDLKNLCNWSADWLMLFNVDKCKVMHLGYNNSKSTYGMNGKDLEEISEERDLGVIVQQDLKWRKQCSKSVSTANRILGMIKRSFCYLSKDVLLKLYKSLVRPHLEYCVQAWRPYLKKDIELIEGVQRRATKLIKSLKDETYENRLKKLHLTSMETRRLRGDLIEVFKMFKGMDNLDVHKFFQLTNAPTRGHSLKLVKHGCNLDAERVHCFTGYSSSWKDLG